MLTGKALSAALRKIEPVPFNGPLFRCVSLRALLGLETDPSGRPVITRPLPDFLYAGGPVQGGGRFTPKGGAPSLYTAESEDTARIEKRQAGGFEAFRKPRAHPIEVVYSLEATLTAVLDLTDRATLEELKTDERELAEPWRIRLDDETPPTHILGVAVVAGSRFSAIRYPSAVAPRGRCMVIFTEKLHQKEQIALVDQDDIFFQAMPILLGQHTK